ncbi:MAG: multidrug effflux MFS transporter [Proteobacteria bacterium]|nr:multidrug effflux MFS transporter [Pseudomonadota bacterium]
MRFPAWLPLLLGFLTAVGPISTDMYLPAFPALEADLGTPAGSAQITLATWFAGLAVGQITQGTLSDRFGRRGPLIVGTMVYVLGSAGCALAPNLFWLSAFRALTAIGASASMVIPRAMVRDLTDGLGAARLMSQLMLVMGVAPILAPTLGSAVLGFASWRAIFWFAVGYGVAGCALVALLLPETLPEQRRVKLGAGGLIQRYSGIIRERVFLTHALMGGAAFFGMFAYIGGSSPVFIEGQHLSAAHYALIFGLCSAGFITASQINPRILPRLGMFRVIRYAGRIYWCATAILLAVAFSGHATVFTLVPPLMVATTCMGFVLPNTTVGALSRHAAHAASASALMGTMQFLMGAVSGVAVGLLTDGTARGMAALMLLGATGAVIADICRTRP